MIDLGIPEFTKEEEDEGRTYKDHKGGVCGQAQCQYDEADVQAIFTAMEAADEVLTQIESRVSFYSWHNIVIPESLREEIANRSRNVRWKAGIVMDAIDSSRRQSLV